VSGDVFRFKQTTGTDPWVEGEMTVSVDEMSGSLFSSAGLVPRGGIVLRRTDASRPTRQQ